MQLPELEIFLYFTTKAEPSYKIVITRGGRNKSAGKKQNFVFLLCILQSALV